jgi:predicted DNA-binding protein with PD1-like motif
MLQYVEKREKGGIPMDYRKFGVAYVVRLDPGDEIVEKVLWLAAVENIRLATVSGLGAVDNVTLGIFSPDTKQYKANMFHADFEIVSLTGTITTQRGRPYAHLHMAVSDLAGRCYGGHLNRAVVSATAEIVIQTLPGEVDRQPDPKIGLNLMHFWPEEK